MPHISNSVNKEIYWTMVSYHNPRLRRESPRNRVNSGIEPRDLSASFIIQCGIHLPMERRFTLSIEVSPAHPKHPIPLHRQLFCCCLTTKYFSIEGKDPIIHLVSLKKYLFKNQDMGRPSEWISAWLMEYDVDKCQAAHFSGIKIENWIFF